MLQLHSIMKRILTGVTALAMAASFALPAAAATMAEIQAQIAALNAQLSTLGGSSMMMSSTMMFNADLTLKSKGADVTALQNLLISKGYSIPAGATGYFGAQTKSAVMKWQVAAGITPAAGYFGPKSRAAVNAMAMGTGTGTGSTSGSTVAGCVAGAMYSSTTGASCSGTTTTGSNTGTITTPGVEGTINIEKETSGVKTTAYEGDSMVSLLGVRIEAKTSDMSVGRVRVSLGTTTDTYTKIFKKIYLTNDAGVVLTSTDLNSSTVTRVSGTTPTYYVTLAGFNYVIPKDAKKSLMIKFDLYPSISSQYTAGSKVVSLYGSDAVRATDGAGLDQYSVNADTTVSQTYNISTNLSDSATLTVSTDPSVRKATTIVADQGANNNEKDKEVLGSFRILAEKDSVLLRDLSVTVASSSATTTQLQTLYLFDGSTQVGTASLNSTGVALFTSINQTITKDVYKTYTIKADFRSAGTAAITFQVGAVTVTSAESTGTGRTLSGGSLSLSSGAGEVMSVVSKGVIATVSSKSIAITKDGTDPATGYHLTATFNMTLKAVGADATFATTSNAFGFSILKNGSTLAVPATSTTSYYPGTQPTGTTGYLANSGGFVLPRNAEITVPVTVKLDANNTFDVNSYFTSGNFSVKLSTVSYISGGVTTAGVNTGGVAVTNTYTSNADYITAEAPRP